MRLKQLIDRGLTLEGLADLLANYVFRPRYLAAPLTSASWDGDAYSTTAKTAIDVNAVFSTPAGIRGVLVRAAVRDSDAAATEAYIILSPNDTAGEGPLIVRCPPADDRWGEGYGLVGLSSAGNLYYQTVASGAGTLDVYIEIWGYTY